MSCRSNVVQERKLEKVTRAYGRSGDFKRNLLEHEFARAEYAVEEFFNFGDSLRSGELFVDGHPADLLLNSQIIMLYVGLLATDVYINIQTQGLHNL
jgi:hypothetical protein